MVFFSWHASHVILPWYTLKLEVFAKRLSNVFNVVHAHGHTADDSG